MTTLRGTHLIAGEESALGTATFHAIAPSIGETLEPAHPGVARAVEGTALEQFARTLRATSDPRFTSVSTAAIQRFSRPVCYQDCPVEFLPPELQALSK